MDKVCKFCFNAHVYANLPNNEEDYFDEGLHDGNDFSSHTIGHGSSKIQMFINSGNDEAVNIEVCRWTEGGYRGNDGWSTVAKYYPKYCPECGRKLAEYSVMERGQAFVKSGKSFVEK